MSYLVTVFGVRNGEIVSPIIVSGVNLLEVNDVVADVIAENNLDSIDTVLIARDGE